MNSSPTILFVCEHGAAKSIIAAAYFNHFAHAQNLPLRAIARGTNPDDEIAIKAAQGLQADGVDVSDLKPKRLSPMDIANAVRVVTFCQLPDGYNTIAIPVDQWSDVPPVSEDYATARNVMVAHLKELLKVCVDEN